MRRTQRSSCQSREHFEFGHRGIAGSLMVQWLEPKNVRRRIVEVLQIAVVFSQGRKELLEAVLFSSFNWCSGTLPRRESESVRSFVRYPQPRNGTILTMGRRWGCGTVRRLDTARLIWTNQETDSHDPLLTPSRWTNQVALGQPGGGLERGYQSTPEARYLSALGGPWSTPTRL